MAWVSFDYAMRAQRTQSWVNQHDWFWTMLEKIAKRLGRISWILVGVRVRLIALLVGSEKTIASRDFESDLHGLRFCGNLSSYIDWRIYFLGTYDAITLRLMALYLEHVEEPVALDVGANVGNHALFLSKHCKVIHAFEPYPPVLAQLKRNISINHLSNIIVHEVGIGTVRKRMPYFENDTNNLGAGSFEVTHEGTNERAAMSLDLVNGDEYLFEQQVVKVDLVKMDVEGFEVDALTGLQETMREYRPAVVFEIGPTTRRKVQTLERLHALFPDDYRFFTIKRAGVFCPEEPGIEALQFDRNGNAFAVPAEKAFAVESRIARTS